MKRETITNDKLNIGRTKMAYVALLIDLYKHEVISKEKAEEILGFKITDYYKDSPYADGGETPPGPTPPTPPTPVTVPVKLYAWKTSGSEEVDGWTMHEVPSVGDKFYLHGYNLTSITTEYARTVTSRTDESLYITPEGSDPYEVVRDTAHDVDFGVETTEPITFYSWGLAPDSYDGHFTLSATPAIGDVVYKCGYDGFHDGVDFDNLEDLPTVSYSGADGIKMSDSEQLYVRASTDLIFEV